jgi:hypothetical protein
MTKQQMEQAIANLEPPVQGIELQLLQQSEKDRRQWVQFKKARNAREFALYGSVLDWGAKRAGALLSPLGLSGVYAVRGIEDQKFTIKLSPKMTPAHILRFLAERGPYNATRLYFKTMLVLDRTIEIRMGDRNEA